MSQNVVHVKNEDTVLHGSRIVLSEGLRPKRIVLVDTGREFVTYIEYLHIRTETSASEEDAIICTHQAFDQGHYFVYDERTRQTRLKRAEHNFRERCSKL